MNDRIFISNLELTACIGITKEERSKPQRLTVSIAIESRRGFSNLNDKLENTVDYAQVCEQTRKLAARFSGNLIETLAEEIASLVLGGFAADAVEIELRKYILPETEYVAVKIRREAAI